MDPILILLPKLIQAKFEIQKCIEIKVEDLGPCGSTVPPLMQRIVEWSSYSRNFNQWRTQKIFKGRISFSGIRWLFAFGVRCLWRHNLTSYSCFQINVIAKFV